MKYFLRLVTNSLIDNVHSAYGSSLSASCNGVLVCGDEVLRSFLLDLGDTLAADGYELLKPSWRDDAYLIHDARVPDDSMDCDPDFATLYVHRVRSVVSPNDGEG